MYCKNCGNELVEGAKVCICCGDEQEEQEEASTKEQ